MFLAPFLTPTPSSVVNPYRWNIYKISSLCIYDDIIEIDCGHV